jgi:Plavaka transposase
MPACKFCGDAFTTGANVQKHQSQAPDCLRRVEEEFRNISRLRRERRAKDSRPPFLTCGNTDFGPIVEADVEVPFFAADTEILPQDGREEIDVREETVVDWDASAPTNLLELEQDDDIYSRKNVKRVQFPIKDGLNAGHAYRLGRTAFENIQDDLIRRYGGVLGPFKDDPEWELARWMIKNVGHGQADTLLKLSIVSHSQTLQRFSTHFKFGLQISKRAQPSFYNKKKFLERIDDLPEGVQWKCDDLEITGDEPDLDADPSGNTMRKEILEFWHRDPVDCVRELIGNPAFDGYLKYAPERHFADAAGESEVINEMWTASWWWKMQVSNNRKYTMTDLIKNQQPRRNAFRREPPSLHSSFHQIRQSSRIFEATPQHGPFISQSGIFRRK